MKWLSNIWDKIKNGFKSFIDGVKRCLCNLKLWLVKNIDFIKKCLATAFIGLLCLAVLPFSCKTSNNTANAEQVNNDVSFVLLDYLGNTNFSAQGSWGQAGNVPYSINFFPSVEINSLNQVYIVASNTRTRIDEAYLGGADDLSHFVYLPKVFNYSIYTSQQGTSIQLVVVDCLCNLTVSDLSRSNLTLNVSIDNGVTNLATFNFTEPISGNHLKFSLQVYNADEVLLTPSTNHSFNVSDILVYSVVDSQGGYDIGYDNGYSDGFSEGADVGYDNAISDGEAQGFFASIAKMVNDLVSVELFPGVPISYILLIAFGLVALRIILNLFAT